MILLLLLLLHFSRLDLTPPVDIPLPLRPSSAAESEGVPSESWADFVVCLVLQATVWALNYRRPPQHPWPTPVQDCLEAYRWLLAHDVSPKRVVFAGDSAGGGLVPAVMAAARKAGLAAPAGTTSCPLLPRGSVTALTACVRTTIRD